MTFKEKWEEKGRQDGVLQVARRFLKNGFEVPMVEKVTGLSEREIGVLEREST